MSKLEELIQQYCPDGVEWKTLAEATIMKRGTSVTKGIMQEGNIPVISGGRQPAFYCNVSNRTGEVITVAGSGAGAGYVQYWNEPIFVCDAFSIQGNETLKTKYVYYILINIQEKIYSTKKGGGVPHVHISSIEKFEIPVPPLPVQEEIVRILDNFTELQAELQAELQKRKLQYNYYLDNLLNFNRGGYQAEVRWMKMSEVFETITDYTAAGSFKSIAENVKYLKSPDYAMLIRTTDLKSRFRKGDFIYVSKSAFDYLWRVKMDKECIVMPNVGNCGEIYYVHPNSLPYDNCVLAPNAILVRSKLFNNKYLSYCLQVECFQKQLAKITSPVGQSKFNKTELKKLLVPIPSLADQQKIVIILDRFDRLTNDLTAGLPAEIEKRRQQYEYYRDKLLTFKRKAA